MSQPGTASVEATYVERADELDQDALLHKTVDNQFFLEIRRRLQAQGAKLLVGPRGTGKTHQMRYVYQECVKDQARPAAIFTSFSRYVRLEPLLKTTRSAVLVFHAWVVAKIALGGVALLRDVERANEDTEAAFMGCFGLTQADASRFVALIESRGGKDVPIHDGLTLGALHDWFDQLLGITGRARMVLLLDDAALSMTPEYLVEFFNIFQDLKSSTVSPKASVYPGTSQYGPRLHLRHDVQAINAWLSLDDPSYDETMSKLVEAWAPDTSAYPDGVVDLFKLAAFGVPRVLMSLIRAYDERASSTAQQGVNAVIEQQVELMQAEYASLAQKVPQFRTVIAAGETLFSTLADKVAEANRQEDAKQLIVGIAAKDIHSLEARMLRFLVEVGFLYPMTSVKHGEERAYLRFMPHLAPLIHRRAFQPSSGFSARRQVTFLKGDHKRQPLRFSVAKLLPEVKLRLDLSRCSRCGAGRALETQKFCHNCGAELIEQSLYEACMDLPIDVLPITHRQKQALRNEQFSTIGDIIAAQDPATELRSFGLIGQKRAITIAEKAQKYVDEYFS